IGVFRDLLKQSNSRSAVRLLLSDAYRDANYVDDAAREWKAALASDPKAERAHYRLGMLALARKDWNMTPEARSEFAKEVQANPHDFFGNYALGLTDFFDQHYEPAERHLREIQTKLLLRMDTASSMSGGMAQMSAMAAAFSSLPQLEAEEILRASLQGGTFPYTTASYVASPKQVEARKARDNEVRKILSSALNDLGAVDDRQDQFTVALAHFHEAERWYADTPGLMRNLGMAAARAEDYRECARA